MKTPREILLARHRAAAPKLDAIRRSVVSELNNEDAKAQSLLFSFAPLRLCCLDKIWLELVWPCRRIWTGLAAVWILIFIINVSQHDGSPAGKARSPAAPEMMMTIRDQQKLLNELFVDRALPLEAESPKTYLPKSRTENMRLETV